MLPFPGMKVICRKATNKHAGTKYEKSEGRYFRKRAKFSLQNAIKSFQISFLPFQEIPVGGAFQFALSSYAMKWSKLLVEPWPRIIGIPLLGCMLTFAFNSPPYTAIHFLVSITITGIIWQCDYMIIIWFRKTYPKLEDTPKRLLYTVGLILLFNTAFDMLVCEGLARLGLQEDRWNDYIFDKLLRNLAATFAVGTLYEAGYFFNRWKIQSIETEQIKSERLRAELSTLKNQISPHFLFNSLNTLVALIHENQAQAVRFTEKLSEVYRYILQYKDREVVPLSTEVHFTEAYLFLLKMRFERGLEVNIDLAASALSRHVAPLTLQILVENAVKHNVVSPSRPLHIDIYIEYGSRLIVRNNLQRKPAEGKSTLTGLENIRRRYSHLSDVAMDVIETREYFMVALPLLSLAENAEEVLLET